MEYVWTGVAASESPARPPAWGWLASLDGGNPEVDSGLPSQPEGCSVFLVLLQNDLSSVTSPSRSGDWKLLGVGWPDGREHGEWIGGERPGDQRLAGTLLSHAQNVTIGDISSLLAGGTFPSFQFPWSETLRP